MALDQVRANQLLDAIHGVASLTAITAPIRCRYMTANGSATANGTELATSGGYTSGTGAPSVTWGTAASGTSATTANISTTNMPATTVVGVEFWDSNGTPKRQSFGALTASKTTASGDTFTISSGAATEALV